MKFGLASASVAVATLASLASATPVVADSPLIPHKRASLPPVTVQGNAFFAGNDRFFIRGVDYQPGGSSDPVDPIANIQTCKRDLPYFKQLGVNTIRVYTVDNSANHDECMNMLAEAGIYLALDVNSGLYSLNRNQPSISYNAPYLQSVFATIDAFAKYDNTLLFFSGNEVINDATNTNCAPFVKAVTRDMKQYIQARQYRSIPVGYSAADVAQNRYQMASYMNCGGSSARSDFFSFNDYSFCDSSFVISGWADEVQLYSNYSIPLFLSETGCNKVLPRTFPEIQSLYSNQMTAVYSGALIYEYSEEPAPPNFGLVQIQSPTSVSLLPDFNNLEKQYAANPAPSGTAGYKTNLQPLDCPTQSSMWEVGNDQIPNTPSGALQYFKNGAGQGPGLTGPGSQTSGSGVHTYAVPGDSYDTSTGTSDGSSSSSSSGSGSSSSSSPSSSHNAAAGLTPPVFELGPLACGVWVVALTFFTGFSLL